MIFKIRNIGETSNSAYNEKRRELVNFMSIILCTYLENQIYKSNKFEASLIPQEIRDWERKYIPNNAAKKGSNLIRKYAPKNNSDGRNTITPEDLLWMAEKFLNEEGMVPGKGGDQLAWVLGVWDDFDPDRGKDQKKSKIYNVYDKKIGNLFDGFEKYLQSNINELITMKNSTTPLLESGEKSEEKGEGSRTKGQDINQIGKEEEYNLHSTINITRDFCQLFFDSESDKITAKLNIAKIYNTYLHFDIINKKQGSGCKDYLIGKTVKMNDKDLEMLDKLVDMNYVESILKKSKHDNIYSKIFKIIREGSDEMRRTLSDFFCLLVKGEYKITVKGNPYFGNLDLFRTVKVSTLDDFKRAVDSTTLIGDGYSEFILLKDHNIKDILEDSTARTDRYSFRKSMSQSPTVQSTRAFVEISDERLRKYLETIVTYSEPCRQSYDIELVEGISRETVNNEDIKLAMKLLGKFEDDIGFRGKIREFGTIADLLNWEPRVNVLDSSDISEVLQTQLTSILNGRYKTKEFDLLNSERLVNLWSILKNVHDEIITMEDDLNISNRISETTSNFVTRYGVKAWMYNGYPIPKVERAINHFFVSMFDSCKVMILNPKLDEAKFNFLDQNFKVTPTGVESEYAETAMADVSKMMKQAVTSESSKTAELSAMLGVDQRYQADSITNWLKPNIKSSLKNREQAVENELKDEEKLYGDDFTKNIIDADVI